MTINCRGYFDGTNITKLTRDQGVSIIFYDKQIGLNAFIKIFGLYIRINYYQWIFFYH